MADNTQLLPISTDLLGIGMKASREAARSVVHPVVRPSHNHLLSLPYDTHCDILEWLAFIDPPHRRQYLGWIAFSQTCKGLRSTALEQARLWARVVLIPKSISTRSLFLERSGEAGLTISLDDCYRSEDLNFCAQYLTRAEELRISVPAEWISRQLAGANLPLLRTLHLRTLDAAHTEISHTLLEGLNAPNLTNVVFCDTIFPLHAPSLRFVTLKLIRQPDLIPPMAILDQLRAAPLLEEIQLCNVLTSNDHSLAMDETAPITLSHLKRFSFRGSLQAGLESLAALRLPEDVVLDMELHCDSITPPYDAYTLSMLVRQLVTNSHAHAEPATQLFELTTRAGLGYFASEEKVGWTHIDPAHMEIDRQALRLCIPRESPTGVTMSTGILRADPWSDAIYAPELRAAFYTGVFVPFESTQLRILAIRHIPHKIPLHNFLEVLRQSPRLTELYLDEAVCASTPESFPVGTMLPLPSLAYVVYRGPFGTFKEMWTRLAVPKAASLHLGFLDEQIAGTLEDRHFLAALHAQDSRDTTVYLSFNDLDWSLRGYFLHCGSQFRFDAARCYTTFTGQHVFPGVFLCIPQSSSQSEESITYHNPQGIIHTFLSVIDGEKIDTLEMNFASLLYLHSTIKSTLDSYLRQLAHIRCIAFCHGAPLGQLYSILASTTSFGTQTRTGHCFPELTNLVERHPVEADRVHMEHYCKPDRVIQTRWAVIQGIVRDRLWVNKPIRRVEVVKPANFLPYGEDPALAAKAFDDNVAYTVTLGCDVLVRS